MMNENNLEAQQVRRLREHFNQSKKSSQTWIDLLRPLRTQRQETVRLEPGSLTLIASGSKREEHSKPTPQRKNPTKTLKKYGLEDMEADTQRERMRSVGLEDVILVATMSIIGLGLFLLITN